MRIKIAYFFYWLAVKIYGKANRPTLKPFEAEVIIHEKRFELIECFTVIEQRQFSHYPEEKINDIAIHNMSDTIGRFLIKEKMNIEMGHDLLTGRAEKIQNYRYTIFIGKKI